MIIIYFLVKSQEFNVTTRETEEKAAIRHLPPIVFLPFLAEFYIFELFETKLSF